MPSKKLIKNASRIPIHAMGVMSGLVPQRLIVLDVAPACQLSTWFSLRRVLKSPMGCWSVSASFRIIC